MAAIRKKLSKPARAGKTAATKTAAKAAVKTKTATKSAAKAGAKKVAGKTAKPAARPATKAVAKTAVKTKAKAAAPAARKAATKVSKPAAKPVAKPVTKATAKKAVKTAAKSVAKPAVKAAVKAVAKKTAVKNVAAPKPVAPIAPAAPVANPKGLRGIQGAKAARIAQIVAESFLPKPAAPESPSQAAATAPQAAPQPASGAGEALDTVHKAAAVLFAKKAEDVVLMDLRNLSTVADYYLIATCQNEPQMRAILGTVQRALSREGIKALRSEYMPGVRWAVVDYGDVILHLFEKQTRGFYSLERLWGDAPSKTLNAADYAVAETEEDSDDDGDL